ncbi:unnamed protein product, partial [Tetraodon nigroviridis]
EKLLFEKFWKGTFKAVASPRPESVIVASITARRRVSRICSDVVLTGTTALRLRFTSVFKCHALPPEQHVLLHSRRRLQKESSKQIRGISLEYKYIYDRAPKKPTSPEASPPPSLASGPRIVVKQTGGHVGPISGCSFLPSGPRFEEHRIWLLFLLTSSFYATELTLNLQFLPFFPLCHCRLSAWRRQPASHSRAMRKPRRMGRWRPQPDMAARKEKAANATAGPEEMPSARSPSFDEDVHPRPKGRKKRKSRRKRKSSPSRSLSPPRKKKKKKKKSSKKSKRHRYPSKKSKHSSSSLKRKRKEERKHKKSSRTRSRRRRCYQRHHLQKSAGHPASGGLAAVVKDSSRVLDQTDMKWRPAAKSLCKKAPKYRSILSTATVSTPQGSGQKNYASEQILSSHPGSRLAGTDRKESRRLTGQNEGLHSYDSGNDTSSPPSGKTVISPASVAEGKRSRCKHLDSPERLKITDSVSDSGNSVTSYHSLCKSYQEDGFSATLFNENSKRAQRQRSAKVFSLCRAEISVGSRVEVSPQKASSCSQRMSRSSQSRRSCSSMRSSGSSKYCGRSSRSLSSSSCSSYSRSLTDLSGPRRRGSLASLSSAGSYCRYSSDRRSSTSRETDVKRSRKTRKRRRRKSYSPLKKRRRDSPSHLEARRITSARKRPIPYFRPSPSSSSHSASISSWSSIFSRNRSRSRSRSRSSSYRSYSRSSSWNSIFGSRSRSRSRGSPNKRNRARR